MQRPIERRHLLAGLPVGAALLAARRARAASLPGASERPGLLVGGPRGSAAERWASALAEPLGHAMQLPRGLALETTGGADGVTAANQFQARVVPDGATALLVSGAAPLAWLTGDTRVRFDVGRWTPLWASTVPAVVVHRDPLPTGRPLRLGMRGIAGPSLAALLTVDALGHEAAPAQLDLAGANQEDAARQLARPDLDVLLLTGSVLRAAWPALAASGWTPAFGLGVATAEGEVARDPAYPDLPTGHELLARSAPRRSPELLQACRAVSAAATLDAALVLPLQAPAASVAWWRQGCAAIGAGSGVEQQAQAPAARALSAGEAAATLRSLAVDASVLLALRHFLADRYGWQPS